LQRAAFVDGAEQRGRIEAVAKKCMAPAARTAERIGIRGKSARGKQRGFQPMRGGVAAMQRLRLRTDIGEQPPVRDAAIPTAAVVRAASRPSRSAQASAVAIGPTTPGGCRWSCAGSN
jgi:hypothetical protein